MRLKPEQLQGALARGLAPVYFLSGDEPLQRREAEDAIRAVARQAGHTEREVLDVDARFDWKRLGAAGGNFSLFGDRRLVELRMPTAKPGRDGARALVAYCTQPPADTILLISSGRLDSKARNAAWVKALDRAGVMIQVWPLAGRSLRDWLGARMRSRGLQPADDAVELLAERSEGNLLAASQEIDKLHLQLGGGAVSLETLRQVVADSARFSIFDLGEAALAGDIRRTLRILRGLRDEGEEPTLALWALSREIRLVCQLRCSNRHDALLSAARVFGPRLDLLKRAARRGSTLDWEGALGGCARVDRLIKGAEKGDAWQALRELGVATATIGRRGGTGSDVTNMGRQAHGIGS